MHELVKDAFFSAKRYEDRTKQSLTHMLIQLDRTINMQAKIVGDDAEGYYFWRELGVDSFVEYTIVQNLKFFCFGEYSERRHKIQSTPAGKSPRSRTATTAC